jgi:hypothetical protein
VLVFGQLEKRHVLIQLRHFGMNKKNPDRSRDLSIYSKEQSIIILELHLHRFQQILLCEG